MTIASLFTFFSPCGASSNPPQSPPPTSTPNNVTPITPVQRKGIVVDCSKVMKSEDRATTLPNEVISENASASPQADKAKQDQAPEERPQLDVTPIRREDHEAPSSRQRSRSTTPPDPNACEASEGLIRVFGLDTLHELHSKAWDDRAKALSGVQIRVQKALLEDADAQDMEDLFAASACVVQITLSDRVLPVYLSALELAKLLLEEFAPRHHLRDEVLIRHATAMVPIIVAKTSDRNTRAIEATHCMLIAMCRVPALSCRLVMANVLLPLDKDTKVSGAIRGRLELILQVVKQFGFSKSGGASLSAVMGWVRPHLEAADEKVRHAAVEVTVACYKHKGARTLQYVKDIKPALLKLLEARFDEASGSPKSKRTKERPSGRSRPLPALKGQQGKSSLRWPPSRTSSRQSTNSSSSGGAALTPLSGTRGPQSTASEMSRPPSELSLRGGVGERRVAEETPQRRAMGAGFAEDPLSPPSVHGPTSGNDLFGSPTRYSAQERDGTEIFKEEDEEDLLMKEIEGL